MDTISLVPCGNVLVILGEMNLFAMEHEPFARREKTVAICPDNEQKMLREIGIQHTCVSAYENGCSICLGE